MPCGVARRKGSVAGDQVIGASRHSDLVKFLVFVILELSAGIVGRHELPFRFDLIEQRFDHFHREIEPRPHEHPLVFFEYSVVEKQNHFLV